MTEVTTYIFSNLFVKIECFSKVTTKTPQNNVQPNPLKFKFSLNAANTYLCFVGRHLEVEQPSWAFLGEIWTYFIVLKIAILDVTK